MFKAVYYIKFIFKKIFVIKKYLMFFNKLIHAYIILLKSNELQTLHLYRSVDINMYTLNNK